MKFDRMNRRMFLSGSSGALLALPWLPSLLPRAARAQSSSPLRFVAVKSYSTQNLRSWYPSFSGNGYSARPYDPGDGKADGTTELTQRLPQSSGRHSDGNEYFGRWAPLTDLAAGGSLSPVLGAGFNPYLSRSLLLRGLDFMPDTNHNQGGMLGNFEAADNRHGAPEVPTIDQVLAHSPHMYSSAPVGTRSLHLSPGRANTFSFTDGGTGGAVSQVTAHVDPLTAFNEAFGSFMPAGEDTGPDPNLRLVDHVIEDYRRVMGGSRISGADRQLLDQHITFLSEVQARLTATSTVSCDEPLAPPSVRADGVGVSELETSFQLMVDVMVAALRCDVTRIATLNVWKAIGRGIGPNGTDLGFVHSGLKDAQDWHETAHRWGTPDDDAKILAMNQWIADEVFLRILDGLDVEEADGRTFLDNSVVMWGNELGMNHLNWSVPALLVGSAGGALQTGRYIDYIDWDRNVRFHQEDGPVIEGVPYNRLLVSLLQAYGLSPAEYERNSQAGYGTYATSGKNASAHAIDYDASQYGQPLPSLAT